MSKAILELKDIKKTFPGAMVLKGVKLDVLPGEVHALCGENGAGKSTLMKIVAGAQSATSGEIWFDGQRVSYSSTREAQHLGISMIYQEFNLVPHLSVAENIFLGKLPQTMGRVDWKKLYSETQKVLDMVGIRISPKHLISQLTVAQMQMVEIAKCLSTNAKIIIMDEPTAALTDEEVETLFKIIDDLTGKGIGIIYISHRMDEIFRISSRITVFRDGEYIQTLSTKDTNYDEIVALMVGRSIQNLFPEREPVEYNPVLEVKSMSGKGVEDVSFAVSRGEILAIYGLMGSGTIELSKLLYGAIPKTAGVMTLGGKEINAVTPRAALNSGIGLVPDDRKNEGLVLIRSIRENISMSSLNRITVGGVINSVKEDIAIKNSAEAMKIKMISPDQQVGLLSGGNQQKVVLSKVLRTSPQVLILDEPTRGVDVGAKLEIYQIMDLLTKQGKSILLVSSDLPELIGMADRIIVMREGRVVKELERKEATQELILAYASGGVNVE